MQHVAELFYVKCALLMKYAMNIHLLFLNAPQVDDFVRLAVGATFPESAHKQRALQCTMLRKLADELEKKAKTCLQVSECISTFLSRDFSFRAAPCFIVWLLRLK